MLPAGVPGAVWCVGGPGPVARGHRSQARRSLRCPPHRQRSSGVSVRVPSDLWPSQLTLTNFACNSPETLSNHELTMLELQRFQTLLKLLPIELHARFGWRWCRRLPRVPQPGPPVPPVPSSPAGPGVLTCGWARRLVVRPGPATARSPHFVLCSCVLHPIRRHCAPSDRVQRAVRGVAPHRGACGRQGGAQWLVAKWCYTI